MMEVDQALSWSELAAVVHGLVLEGRKTIEDRLSRVMAYSRLQQHADPARVEKILDRQAPERLRTCSMPAEYRRTWRLPTNRSSSPRTPNCA